MYYFKSEAKMNTRTVNQDEFTKKTITDPYVHHLADSQLHLGNQLNSEGTFTSVSHNDFQGKYGDPGSLLTHGAMQISSLSLGNNSIEFSNRTKSHEDFSLKIAKKLNPVRKESQLKIDTSCKNFFIKKLLNKFFFSNFSTL